MSQRFRWALIGPGGMAQRFALARERRVFLMEAVWTRFLPIYAVLQRCIRAGQIESAVMPHAETLATLAWMDEIRAQLGVRYPFE